MRTRPSLCLLLAILIAAAPEALAARPRARGFDLFAVPGNLLLDGNRVQCNINNIGELCVDPTNSPVRGGGFWPRGTQDQYIFNQGLQVAGIIDGTDVTGYEWPGDTVGVFFFDPRGDQAQGEGLAGPFDFRATRDRLRWPSAARANDPGLFAPALLGSNAVSEQDSWLRMWDGGPQVTGRPHPAGIMVDFRTMAWNGPGLEDVVFFVYRIVNITASNPAVYQQLASSGYSAEDIAEIAALGARFNGLMQQRFHVTIPAGGYALLEFYAGFSQDADIGQAGSNYSNGSLVFANVMAYKSDFREAFFEYPTTIFAPPFASAPGLVGEALLRAPQDAPPPAPRAGIRFMSNLTGGAPFPDVVGVQRLWRRLSGNLLPSDGTCSVPNPLARHFCFWTQVGTDTRVYFSAGPRQLAPGEAAVMIVAQVQAAPVDSAVRPFIGTDMKPGFAVDGARLVAGADTVRNLDRVAGWVSATDANANGAIEAREVSTVPRSLFWKIQRAQATADAGFLQPQAPAAPLSAAVGSDGRVTVVWQESASESAGDPYFPVASNVASPLYDPDFRQHDVEGYRVWRGTSVADMRVVAQYDHAGTLFVDYTGQVPPDFNNSGPCAPEFGVTAGCRPFPATYSPNQVVQIRLGDRILLTNGDVSVLRADTAVTGGASGRAVPSETGVPFVFVDSGLTNGRTYLYAVTAFDVNSYRSGASTMESPLVLHAVTPRVPASNSTSPPVLVTALVGNDTTTLDPAAPFPSVDAATGTFRGTVPPANGGSFLLPTPVVEALAAGDYEARVDSVIGGVPQSLGAQPVAWMTLSGPGVSWHFSFPVPNSFHANSPYVTEAFTIDSALVPYDSAQAVRAGYPPSYAGNSAAVLRFTGTYVPLSAGPAATMLCGRGLITAAGCGSTLQASRYLLHSRWYDEGAAEPPDPTTDFNPSAAHNSGSLAGVSAIWAPQAYRTPLGAGGATRVNASFRYYSYALSSWYPADFVVTWSSSGITVRDSTHHTDLPFNRTLGAGYGFVSMAALASAGVTPAQLNDGQGTPGLNAASYHALYTANPVCLQPAKPTMPPCVNLSPTLVIQGLDFNSDGVAEASGLVLVINGEAFWMQTPSVPAPGTRWHLRAVGGLGLTATCSPALPAGTIELLTPPSDCDNYAYTPPNPVRSPLAPGLTYRITVQQAFALDTTSSGDLSRVHTVPDPYYLTNSLETGAQQILRFVNLPAQAIIRIYTSSGVLVTMVSHNDATGGGEEAWNLRSRSGRSVASGVYFFHVEGPDGRTRVGRFVIVNRAL